MSLAHFPFRAKTTVSWPGEEDGDLGFMEGEIIEVYLEVDESWWSGRLRRNGAEGIFPKDYVVAMDSVPGTPGGSRGASAPSSPQKGAAAAVAAAAASPYGLLPGATASAPALIAKSAGRTGATAPPAAPSMPAGAPAAYGRSSQSPQGGVNKSGSMSNLASGPVGDFPGLVHSHTVGLFGRRGDGARAAAHARIYEVADHEIAEKRRQLERELEQLKVLERQRACGDAAGLYVSVHSLRDADDLGAKLARDNDDDDDEAPPPPPKRVVYDDEFRFGEFGLSQAPHELRSLVKLLQSDVLNLSELSATSAGSFMRHKWERAATKGDRVDAAALAASGTASGTASGNASGVSSADVASVFESSKPPNIFRKLLPKKPENALEQKLATHRLDDGEVHWTTYKADLNRTNLLTTQTKQARTKRIVRSERLLIVKPLEFVSDINLNEVAGDDAVADGPVLSAAMAARAEQLAARYPVALDLNEFIGDVGARLAALPAAQVKAVLLRLCKFGVAREEGAISQQKPRLALLMAAGAGTVYQLNYVFKKMLDALGIALELVVGFWKRPNEFYHDEHFVANHCWLLVLLAERFLMVDLYNYKMGAECNLEGPNDFYCLAPPLHLVLTHLPQLIEMQHVVPPVDQNIAFYLPRMYSGFYNSRLRFRNFNNALTRLADLEIFELELELPCDVELFALVKTSRCTTHDLTLCQVMWVDGTRVAKIKALLPEHDEIGVLQVFAGPKGRQRQFDNIHELAAVVPLYHSGTYRACRFVARFPTVHAQNNDLYVKQPQTATVIVRNAYNFEVLQHPLRGVNSGLGIMNRDLRLVVELPSGKYYKLVPHDPGQPSGTHAANIKCTELGLYRGLVIGDTGASWYVFAQWECVAGVVKN